MIGYTIVAPMGYGTQNRTCESSCESRGVPRLNPTAPLAEFYGYPRPKYGSHNVVEVLLFV